MSSDAPPSGNQEPAKGLPTVLPPSGRHIVQLFVVPGLIVAVALLLLLGFTWLVGGASTPDRFLRDLDSSNADIRWRAANDLAQVLKRDEVLARDVDFLLGLADKYQQALLEFAQSERDLLKRQAQLSDTDLRKEKETLRAKRNHAIYLGACLGNSTVPVGAPVLARTFQNGGSADKETNALIRRQAVWALANLANNLKENERASPEARAEVLQKLERAARSSGGDRQQWAQQALDYLQKKQPLGVIDALNSCVRDDDIFLRGLIALTLNFWDEGPDKDRVAEQALVQLSEDVGHGEWIFIDTPELPALPGGR